MSSCIICEASQCLIDSLERANNGNDLLIRAEGAASSVLAECRRLSAETVHSRLCPKHRTLHDRANEMAMHMLRESMS